ncbi:hypothetical protein Krac_4667 [Ktedonobacter racemifer DSM 44963]|uniref:Uncharacterized protein n=1 Tax=Ktedonobacter racemifer DSM 44963 TaxID=485913 RepID=D6TTC3_KTERA|nr:hypothetical protein Krac_4667 [Ktedonobacter racemifer DSM 44963]
MFGKVVAKFVEVMLPTRSPLGDPLLGCAQHGWLDTAGAHPPNLLRSDEAARLQHLKVLNDCWKRHSKWLGEFADRRRSLTQPLHYDSPSWVCQRVEDEIKRDIIVKHVLNYNGQPGICQVPPQGVSTSCSKSLFCNTGSGSPLSAQCDFGLFTGFGVPGQNLS